MKNLIHNSAVLVFFIILSLFYTYPAINHFSTHIIGDGGDGFENYSNMMFVRERLISGKSPFGESELLRYPFGINTIMHENKLISLVGGLAAIYINPVSAYNIYVIVIIILNSYISFLFYYSISNLRLVAVIGSIINGFAFFNLSNANGSIGTLTVFWYPLLALFLNHALTRGVRIIHYYIFFALMILVYLCGITPILILLTTFILLAAIGVKNYGNKIIQKLGFEKGHAIHILMSLLLFIVFLGVFQIPLISLMHNQNEASAVLFSAKYIPIGTFVTPPQMYYRSLLGSILNRHASLSYGEWWHDSLYIGIPVIFIFCLSFVISRKKDESLFWYTVAVVVFLIINSALVYTPVRVSGLFALILLPLKFITDYHYMFITPFWFFTAAAIVSGLSKIRLNKVVALFITLALILERVNTGFNITLVSGYDGSGYAPVVKELAGSAVLDIPIDVYSEYNLLPIGYGKPIVGGMVHWAMDTPLRRSLIEDPSFARFSCTGESFMSVKPLQIQIGNQEEMNILNQKMLSNLLLYDIRTIVIHRRRYDSDFCAHVWEHIRSFEQYLNNMVVPGKVEKQYSLTLKHTGERAFVYQLESVVNN